jgi:hypothetical protein
MRQQGTEPNIGMMMNPTFSAGNGGGGGSSGNDEHEGGALTLYSSIAGQTTGDVLCVCVCVCV